MKFAQADFYSGLAFGGLGAHIIVEAWRWEYLGQDGPGPGFFPLWYGIAMVVLSLALIISRFWQRENDRIDWTGAGRAVAMWLALAASVAALSLAGFLLSFAALTFFIVAVMYRRPLKVAAAVAIALAAGFHVLFPLALGVRLPAGLLGF